MFRLGESFLEMLLRLSRCGRDALYSSRCHKPGKEVKVKLFLRRTQSFMATVKEKEQKMHEMSTPCLPVDPQTTQEVI